MQCPKPKYDYFSVLKIVDIALQIFIYLRFLLFILFETTGMGGREAEYLMGATAALGVFLGFYQLLSFVIQLFSWYYYPEIYKSRLKYILWTMVTFVIYAFAIETSPGAFVAFLLLCFLHIIAAYYLSISIKETKMIFYAERKLSKT